MGTVTATTNMVNMLGNVLLQPGIGMLLDCHWTGTMVKCAHVYGLEAYQAAFVLIVGWSLFSCVMILLTSETNCQQTV